MEASNIDVDSEAVDVSESDIDSWFFRFIEREFFLSTCGYFFRTKARSIAELTNPNN